MSKKLSKQELVDLLTKKGAEVDPLKTYKELEAQLANLGEPKPARITQDATAQQPGDDLEAGESASKKPERIKSEDGPAYEPVEGDYLQKYQYRKQTEFGSVASNPQAGSKAEKMKKHLLAQKTVRMMIPLEKGDDHKFPHTVNLNGYRLDFPRNKYIDLPEQIADLIQESFGQTEEALNRFRIDKGNEKELT
jgi:hypothetical protein